MKKIYIVYVHITPDGMHYFGATSNIKRRWSNNGAGYKKTALQPYIEKYGWGNIQHIILFENQSKEDALKIEDSLIISGWEKGNCINQQRSGNISKDDVYIREYQREYNEKNREKILEHQREYREQNREKYNEYHREYREQNREKYNEYHREHQREYREQNREKYNEQRRQRYQENLSKNREKNRIRQQKYRQRKKLEKQLKEVETTLF